MVIYRVTKVFERQIILKPIFFSFLSFVFLDIAYLKALKCKTSGGQAVGFNWRISRLRVGHGYAKTLHPFLSILTIFRLENQGLVSGEDFECLRYVSGPAGHFY